MKTNNQPDYCTCNSSKPSSINCVPKYDWQIAKGPS